MTINAITTSYQLCDRCAPAVVNDDHSGLDDRESAAITALLEHTGYLIPIGPADPGGYWICDGCDDTCIGTSHTFHPIH
ncbi:hypothetical protein [Gordonia sp. N1V]|uniref:hypothetical protein n=1 Tax=Gordonia sp. N1V TaxID=3034163 RepID=UPI0023E30157|nr:hypothetical protein [Gordonia sp. N1V]MDF3284997.1 hypothetical protein [Gordonia sp. N1V]